MLEIVFVVCSLVEGAKCRELAPVPLQPDTHMMACLIATQVEAAKWSERYPNHYVARSTCQPAKTFAKI